MTEDLKEENRKLKAALKLASHYIELSCFACPFYNDSFACDAPNDGKDHCWQSVYDWFIENGGD